MAMGRMGVRQYSVYPQRAWVVELTVLCGSAFVGVWFRRCDGSLRQVLLSSCSMRVPSTDYHLDFMTCEACRAVCRCS